MQMLGTIFLLALRSIRRHMLRSFLTVLGIVIGVGAVVAMTTLGQATTAAVQKQIAALGTNVLQVRPGQGFGRGGGGPRRRADPVLELEDDPLRALLADAGHTGQRLDVVAGDRDTQPVRREYGEHRLSQLGPDA